MFEKVDSIVYLGVLVHSKISIGRNSDRNNDGEQKRTCFANLGLSHLLSHTTKMENL